MSGATNYISVKDNHLIYTVSNQELIINLDTVSYFESEGNYMTIHYIDDRLSKIIRTCTNTLDTLLPPDRFALVHRAFIVSVKEIETINSVYVRLKGIKIPLPKANRKKLMNKIIVL